MILKQHISVCNITIETLQLPLAEDLFLDLNKTLILSTVASAAIGVMFQESSAMSEHEMSVKFQLMEKRMQVMQKKLARLMADYTNSHQALKQRIYQLEAKRKEPRSSELVEHDG